MSRSGRPVPRPVTTKREDGWGTMDGVGQGEVRPASLATRRAIGRPCRRLGRSWTFWAGAAATVAVGVAGALSFGAAPGRVNVPPAVALPAAARSALHQSPSRHADSLEIVPTVQPVVVEPPESSTASDGQSPHAEAGDGAGSADASDGTSGARATTTTSPASEGSGDAPATSAPATPSGDAPATGATEGGSSGGSETSQQGDGATTTSSSTQAKEGDG